MRVYLGGRWRGPTSGGEMGVLLVEWRRLEGTSVSAASELPGVVYPFYHSIAKFLHVAIDPF